MSTAMQSAHEPAPVEPPAEPPAERIRTTVAALRDAVARHRYDVVYRIHCYELAPRWLESSLRQTIGRAPAGTRDLFRLLYFREPLERSLVDGLLGAATADALLDEGMLARAGTAVVSRVRLEIADDTLLLVDAAEGSRHGVYFGEDSQFLRSMIAPRRGDVCLDLCTGSGVQALTCARAAERVDAVDLNPAAVRLATWNVELNGLRERVSVHRGDLWEPLPADARYDHVVCNPPLVPVPEDVAYPLCGHGGADGLTVTRRILGELDTRLTDGGRATLIGACTGDEERAAVVEEAERTLGDTLRIDAFLLLRVPLRDWTRTLTQTVKAVYPGSVPGNTIVRIRARYGAAFDRTFVYTYLLVAERSRPAGCRVFDYSTVGQRSYWYVNRGQVSW